MRCISLLQPLSGLFLILGWSKVCSSLSVTSSQNLTVAVIGKTVSLPCHFSPSPPDPTYELIWTRRAPQLPPHNVFHVRRGQSDPEKQHPRYRGRAMVDLSGLSDGEASLQLYNTSLWDEGQYECFVFQDPDHQNVTLQLQLVASYSQPVVSCEPQPGNASRFPGVLLVCRAEGGYPQGEIHWVLNNESVLHSPNLTHSQDSRGLYRLQSSTVWPIDEPSESVSCTVHNPRLKQNVSSPANCTAQSSSSPRVSVPPVEQPRSRLLVMAPVVLCVVLCLTFAWKLRQPSCDHDNM